MEYFDFEDACQPQPDVGAGEDESRLVDTLLESGAGEGAQARGKDHDPLPVTAGPRNWLASPPPPGQTRRLRVNNTWVEVEQDPDDFDGVFPAFRAKTACDPCRAMGLDCFIAQRGALVNGCTCCISLYRECSFTFASTAHRPARGNFLDVLGKVTEDAQECLGSIVTKRALKSLPGSVGGGGGAAAAATAPDGGHFQKNTSRLPREAVRVLKKWLSGHAEHPYPTEEEKAMLVDATALERGQILNWLANARRRGKVRKVSTSSAADYPTQAVDINRPSSCGSLNLQNMSPLERWKHSPPEHEAASVTAIARAVADAPLTTGGDSSQTSRQGSRQDSRRPSSNGSSYSLLQAPSMSSLETSQSSASILSRTSSISHASRGSFGSMDQKERRRRRRAPIAQRRATQKQKEVRIYQCTFCADTFSSKYDWQRHEKSLHLALEHWVCAPQGGILQHDGELICCFCRLPNPTTEHVEAHNLTECQEKPLAERTFYRKDHLRQHLKLLHGARFGPCMESWKSMMSDIKSSCGFCPCVFSTWEQRADHLAAHFKDGADMSSWSGSWGFEPHIEHLVENSIPPFLNGNERASMNPFVARAIVTNGIDDASMAPGNSTATGILADARCWRRLEKLLSEHIVQQRAAGQVPTDQELQARARLIIFDDDDPWNQTAADNEQWLATLKFQHGIVEDPGASLGKIEEVPIMPPYAVQGGLKNRRRTGRANELTTASPMIPDIGQGMIGTCLPTSLDHAPLIFDFDQLKFDDGGDVFMENGSEDVRWPDLRTPVYLDAEPVCRDDGDVETHQDQGTGEGRPKSTWFVIEDNQQPSA